MGQVQSIPCVQIRPKYLLIYNRLEGLPPRSTQLKLGLVKLLQENAAYAGLMTKGSVKRLKRAIELLVVISDKKKAFNPTTKKYFFFRVNFITLTLPAPQLEHTDKDLKKKLLDPWIKSAKRIFGMRSYVWRAEKQKNGNIHFHIMSNVYMHWEKLRDSWNKQLARLDFIDRFESVHGHRNPNSTDVHSVTGIKNLAAYMVKYMAKSHETSQAVDGRLWDCSINLKRKDSVEFVIDSETNEWLNSCVDTEVVRQKVTDHCTLLFFEEKDFLKIVWGKYREAYKAWIESIKNFEKVHRITTDLQSQKKVSAKPKKRIDKKVEASAKIKFKEVWRK